jgi:hypothetical protein
MVRWRRAWRACHTTRWAIVLRAAQSQVLGGQSALAELCRLYEEAANRLQVSTDAVKTLIHRMRKRYIALLREEVGRTVSDPAEIDKEIHALCEALVASGGRVGP